MIMMKKIISNMQYLINLSNQELNNGIELPVSALIIKNNKIIASATNKTEEDCCFIRHAEIIVIEKACDYLKTKYLNDCEIFISMEPCIMCLHAINLSRIKKIIFGSFNNEQKPVQNYFNIAKNGFGNIECNIEIFGGFFEDEFNKIMKSFFEKMRN